MKQYTKYTFATLGIIVAVLVLGFLIQGTDFIAFRFWAPKYEQARRETFEQSKAYTDGMAQELDQLRIEYTRAKTTDEKKVLKSVILHKSANFDLDNQNVSYDLATFIRQLRSN